MTTTLDKLDTINDSLNDIKTAIIGKGQTPSGNITTYATAIDNIVQSSPVIDSLSITPTTSAQTITAPSGTDGYSPITVSAVTAAIDSNITASNIKSGVSILGVTGTVTELNGETRTATLTSSAGNTFTPSSGKNAITSITVTPNNQARSVTPSTLAQTLSVNSGYSGNGTISVSAVTSSIDANITAENIKKDVTILGVTGSLESGGGEFQLTRIKDDNNVEIGTHYMDFVDGSNNSYKVIVLDAQYRNEYSQWCSSSSLVTNMPVYINNLGAWWYDNAKETATQNTQLILDYCSAGGYTSTACTQCRSKSFTINGTTYYGQLPNMREVFDMWRHRVQIEQMDTSASSQSSTNFSSARSIWSSNQAKDLYAWRFFSDGQVSSARKTDQFVIDCPVLEIPY